MSGPKNRRKKIFANKLHKQISWLLFWTALIPTVIVTFYLYYLIFGIMATQFVIPEIIAYHLIPAAKKITIILLATAPIAIAIILFFAYKITHTLLGPFDRILEELDELSEGKKKGPIVVRKTDKFWPLAEKINRLISK